MSQRYGYNIDVPNIVPFELDDPMAYSSLFKDHTPILARDEERGLIEVRRWVMALEKSRGRPGAR